MTVTLFRKIIKRLETIKRLYSDSDIYIEKLFDVRRMIEEMYIADIIDKYDFKVFIDYFNEFLEGELI